MTEARIQTFCTANNIYLRYYNDERVFPRSVTERNIALFLYNNHFCLIWKSEDVTFTQALKELKNNFRRFYNYITDENVKSFFEYKYTTEIESDLTILILYDLGTHNTKRNRPYVFCFYRLSKLAGRYYRNLTLEELGECRKDTIAFEGASCVEKALDFCLKLEGEEFEDKKGNVLKTIFNFKLIMDQVLIHG